MPKLFSFRKPKLRITKKGKLSISGGGIRIGGKGGGINLSRKGVSGTIGSPVGSYNTRRGFTARGLFRGWRSSSGRSASVQRGTSSRGGGCVRTMLFWLVGICALFAIIAYSSG